MSGHRDVGTHGGGTHGHGDTQLGDVEGHMDGGDTERHGATWTQVNTWIWAGTGEWDTGTHSGTQGHVSPSPWQDDFSGPPSPQGLAPEKRR